MNCQDLINEFALAIHGRSLSFNNGKTMDDNQTKDISKRVLIALDYLNDNN